MKRRLLVAGAIAFSGASNISQFHKKTVRCHYRHCRIGIKCHHQQYAVPATALFLESVPSRVCMDILTTLDCCPKSRKHNSDNQRAAT